MSFDKPFFVDSFPQFLAYTSINLALSLITHGQQIPSRFEKNRKKDPLPRIEERVIC